MAAISVDLATMLVLSAGLMVAGFLAEFLGAFLVWEDLTGRRAGVGVRPGAQGASVGWRGPKPSTGKAADKEASTRDDSRRDGRRNHLGRREFAREGNSQPGADLGAEGR